MPAAVLCLCLLASAAAAELRPEQVLVVANARSEPSVVLAQRYAAARGIDERNVVLLQCTTAYAVSRREYDEQIRAPLREALRARGHAAEIRCLALIWGVPVRVMGPVTTPLQNTYRIAAVKAHARLATVYQLVPTIGEDFAPPRNEGLRPLGALFAQPIPVLKEPLLEVELLAPDLERMLKTKHREAAGIEELPKRLIALRQIMAVHLDAGGLRGLTAYLRAHAPGSTNLSEMDKQLAAAEAALAAMGERDADSGAVARRIELLNTIGGAQWVYTYASARAGEGEIRDPGAAPGPVQRALEAADASVDGELTGLLWPPYDLAGPWPNPLHWRNLRQTGGHHPPTLMTARIDGPTPQDAERIIADSLAIEREGLTGVFYIDAGGVVPAYDQHLLDLHEIVRTQAKTPVVLDTRKELFPLNSCPDAALYVGWYSLQQYVPALLWKRGAVGWHIASFEAMNLRDPASNEWCPQMIRNGVAATLGAVDEPLVGTFPRPDEFFPLLLTGRYTLAECYWRTVPAASWRMTLIGDPLYRPFKSNPQLPVEALPEGLAP